jgi:hypothetical protein
MFRRVLHAWRRADPEYHVRRDSIAALLRMADRGS